MACATCTACNMVCSHCCIGAAQLQGMQRLASTPTGLLAPMPRRRMQTTAVHGTCQALHSKATLPLTTAWAHTVLCEALRYVSMQPQRCTCTSNSYKVMPPSRNVCVHSVCLVGRNPALVHTCMHVRVPLHCRHCNPNPSLALSLAASLSLACSLHTPGHDVFCERNRSSLATKVPYKPFRANHCLSTVCESATQKLQLCSRRRGTGFRHLRQLRRLTLKKLRLQHTDLLMHSAVCMCLLLHAHVHGSQRASDAACHILQRLLQWSNTSTLASEAGKYAARGCAFAWARARQWPVRILGATRKKHRHSSIIT